MPPEETLLYDGKKIASVITKNGREIKFYAHSGHYDPKKRAILGDTIVIGQGSVAYHRGTVIPVKVSIDDVRSVKIVKYRGKTASTMAAIAVISAMVILVKIFVTTPWLTGD